MDRAAERLREEAGNRKAGCVRLGAVSSAGLIWLAAISNESVGETTAHAIRTDTRGLADVYRQISLRAAGSNVSTLSRTTIFSIANCRAQRTDSF
jgi:hypothetical protein